MPLLFLLFASPLTWLTSCSSSEGDTLIPQVIRQEFKVLSVDPMPDATGVPSDTTIVVTLTAPLFPEILTGAWNLRTGLTGVTGSLRVDLVRRKLYIRPARGFLPGLMYELFLNETLRSFEGSRLTPFSFVFRTAPPVQAPGSPPAPPAPPAPNAPRPSTEAALTVFREGGCVSSCHGGDRPPFGLALDTARGLTWAFGRPSQGEPSRTLVTTGVHATSYLLWKAMGLGRTAGHRTPVLSSAQAEVLADWIDSGPSVAP